MLVVVEYNRGHHHGHLQGNLESSDEAVIVSGCHGSVSQSQMTEVQVHHDRHGTAWLQGRHPL